MDGSSGGVNVAGGGNGIDTESDIEESKKYGVVSRKVMPQI